MTRNTTEGNGRGQKLDIDRILIDLDRFQSRVTFDEDEYDSDLSDVTVFNADFAGLISVWRDSSDGRIYLVDGHSRLGLARRVGTLQMHVQFLSCHTAGEAFGMGALINISKWIFDSTEKIAKACACRRAAIEKALEERRLDPTTEVARELLEYFPDLMAMYGNRAPTSGGIDGDHE